jgi:hypothetical protein
MESVDSPTQSPVSEVLTLARRFEPVLRYTKGELFLPMPVERYVEAAALFRRTPGQKAPELIAPASRSTWRPWSATPARTAVLILSSTSSTNR